jgi:hypothetical protein
LIQTLYFDKNSLLLFCAPFDKKGLCSCLSFLCKPFPSSWQILDANKPFIWKCLQVVWEDQDAGLNGKGGVKLEFQPVYRSGVWSDTGGRSVMEDAHIRIDDLETHLSSKGGVETSGAFYGVSD